MGAVTPGETLGTLYNIRVHVGSNQKTKQHTRFRARARGRLRERERERETVTLLEELTEPELRESAQRGKHKQAGTLFS